MIPGKYMMRMMALILLVIGCGTVTMPDGEPDASESDAVSMEPDAIVDAEPDPECEAGWAIAHIAGTAYTSVSVETDSGGIISVQPISARRVCATL